RRIDQAAWHRTRGHDIDDALYPGIEHEIAPGHLRHRLHDGVDVGVNEIERDGVVGGMTRTDQERRDDQHDGIKAQTFDQLSCRWPGNWRFLKDCGRGNDSMRTKGL